MGHDRSSIPTDPYSRFRAFHDLMAKKVREILLVSSPYDAFLLEEDQSLASRIINEYSGLNLSQPPRVTRAASATEARSHLEHTRFDMVITTPHLDDMDPFSLAQKIKTMHPGLPVILLAQSLKRIYPPPKDKTDHGIDRVFLWSGNSDLLLAIVKNAEDALNVKTDTRRAGVRVLILVEDSPVYYSSFLPVIYKEIVKQTQAVLKAGLNEEHRLLIMRARPKILLATDYEQAMALCQKYEPYLFGILCDTRFPRHGRPDDGAGVRLLARIKEDIPDLPLLMLSSDSKNREKAGKIPAVFLDKNLPNPTSEFHDFFANYLGFGDFIFKMPDGRSIDRAPNIHIFEEKLADIPAESLWYHARHNHFSNWIMARSEIALASSLHNVKASDFDSTAALRGYVIRRIHELRKLRQKGVVAQFDGRHYDPEIMDFVKMGHGSLGGKARGLAFMAGVLHQNKELHEKYGDITIDIPKTLVLCTDGFESFVAGNHLTRFACEDAADEAVAAAFLDATLPEWLTNDLSAFIGHVRYPLSIRSSSLLEDAQFQPYAGLYKTYMIPNNHPDASVRLSHLMNAVKLVYASTYYEGPKAFARNTANQPQEEAMAVIIQQVAGQQYGDFFYPAISGVCQSHNFYPVPPMKPEEGIAHIALGLGKTVVEGERSLRFSPKYPHMLPQFSTVDDMLKNAQRSFYSLRRPDAPAALRFQERANLEKREINDAEAEFPVQTLSSTYIPEENRVRDTGFIPGPKILTFAQILKHRTFPLPELLVDLLHIGRKGMGCPIEIEFCVNLYPGKEPKGDFNFLQIRPMVANEGGLEVDITREDLRAAVCRSAQVLGNGTFNRIADIVYVKPSAFRKDATPQVAMEVNTLNAGLSHENRPYLLVGPGRWGSADRWLGIPVKWNHISGVGAIVELRNSDLTADPSQGSHFFQNITALGIPYLTVTEGDEDAIDWEWMESLSEVRETPFLRHVRLEHPLTIKIDGRKSRGVIVRHTEEATSP